MHNLARISCVVALALFLGVMFLTSPSSASAHTMTTIQSGHSLHVSLAGTSPKSKVSPNVNHACVTKTFDGKLGTLCIVVYLQCIGPVCVPYAVDVNFSQNLIDGLAIAGGVAAQLAADAIIATFPVLSPFAGIIKTALGAAIPTIVYLARNICGGNGAGVYIGFPSGFTPHC